MQIFVLLARKVPILTDITCKAGIRIKLKDTLSEASALPAVAHNRANGQGQALADGPWGERPRSRRRGCEIGRTARADALECRIVSCH